MSSEFDQVLRAALSQEEKQLWDELAEPSPLQLATDMFRTRYRWLMIFGFSWGIVFMVLGIMALIRFWEAQDALLAIRWGLGFIMCMWGVWALKVWAWMEMQRNVLTREIKRLELQIVHLGAKLGGTTTE